MKRFEAHWSPLLVAMSGLAVSVLIAVPVAILVTSESPVFAGLFTLFCLGVLVGSVPFAIRGYGIDADSILVFHPGWTRRFPRSALRSASHEPARLAGSIRTFGNGGLLSFSGWFYNSDLGAYRAYITDFDDAVILDLDGRIVVLSPRDPEGFVKALNR